jgi:hypothetical protein
MALYGIYEPNLCKASFSTNKYDDMIRERQRQRCIFTNGGTDGVIIMMMSSVI